jgi:hypothetical protein
LKESKDCIGMALECLDLIVFLWVPDVDSMISTSRDDVALKGEKEGKYSVSVFTKSV